MFAYILKTQMARFELYQMQIVLHKHMFDMIVQDMKEDETYEEYDFYDLTPHVFGDEKNNEQD
jgi:hypothetical protein